MGAPICPVCGNPARERQTRHGPRHDCCGLHSWGGKQLVTQAVHDARQRCHAAFDPLWQNATSLYTITEEPGTPERDRAEKRIRKSMRNRAYLYIAHVTGLPEPDCHMSEQSDLTKLAMIETASRAASSAIIRDWYHGTRKAA